MSWTQSGLWLVLYFRSLFCVTLLAYAKFNLKYLITFNLWKHIRGWCFHLYRGCYCDLILHLQQYPYDIPTEAFPFEIFKQAFVAVQSCVVHLQVISRGFTWVIYHLVL